MPHATPFPNVLPEITFSTELSLLTDNVTHLVLLVIFEVFRRSDIVNIG